MLYHRVANTMRDVSRFGDGSYAAALRERKSVSVSCERVSH